MDFFEICHKLETGEIRVAQKQDGVWTVNTWVKEAILEGFRIGKLMDMSEGHFAFFDKDTLPLRKFTPADRVRKQRPLWLLSRAVRHHDASGLCEHRSLCR